MPGRETPQLQAGGHAGSEQVVMESVACLILRGAVDHIIIEPWERRRLYDLFKTGFALTAYEDPRTFEVKLSLVGPDGIPVLLDLIRDGDNGDGTFKRDLVPDMIKIRPNDREGGRRDR